MVANTAPEGRMLYIAEFIQPGYIGGSARYAHDLLAGILQVEDPPAVDLVTRPPSGHYALAGERDLSDYFHQLGVASVTLLCSLRAFARLFRLSLAANLIVAHHPIVAWPIFALNSRRKLCYFFHGPLHLEYAAKQGRNGGLSEAIRKWIQIFVLKRANKIFVLSDYMRRQVLMLHPSADVIIIGPIVSEDFFGPRDPSGLIENKDNKKHIVCVRRLTPRTGVAELLLAFQTLADRQLVLHIVGVGEMEEELRHRHGNDPGIVFHHYLPDTDMRSLIRDADACIIPSITLEGFGLVILEAYANGVPVVATTTSGGAYEFISKVDRRFIYDISAGPESLGAAITFAASYERKGQLVDIARQFSPGFVARSFIGTMRS